MVRREGSPSLKYPFIPNALGLFSLNIHLLAASLTQTRGCFSKSWTSLCLTDKLQLKIKLEGKELSLAVEVIAGHIPTVLPMPHPLCLLAPLGRLSHQGTLLVRDWWWRGAFFFWYLFFLLPRILIAALRNRHCVMWDLSLWHIDTLLAARGLSGCGPWAQRLWLVGSVALQHVKSQFPTQGLSPCPQHCKVDS